MKELTNKEFVELIDCLSLSIGRFMRNKDRYPLQKIWVKELKGKKELHSSIIEKVFHEGINR